MLEHKNNYYFLDSCGYCYERFPHSTINGLIPGKNAFHIESQIQTDDFNCSSFCLEFIKTLYEMYRNKEKQGQDLNEYLQSFFISHGNGEGCEFFVDVVKKKDGDEEVEEDEEEEEEIEDDFRRYGLLPPEILIYFQSLSFLKNIQEILFPNYNQGNKNISESNELNEIKKKIEEKQEAIKRTDIQLKEILESKTRSELESLQRLRNYNIAILNEKKDKLQNDLLSIANKQQKICDIQQSIIALLPKELQTGDISNLSREERIKYQKINQARKEHIQLLFSLYKAMQQNKSEQLPPIVTEETQQQNTSPKATPTKEVVDGTKKLTTEINKSQIKLETNDLTKQTICTPSISGTIQHK